jgi:hypothetical protein
MFQRSIQTCFANLSKKFNDQKGNKIVMFSFLHRHDEAFSTEPVRSNPQTKVLKFDHVQDLRANVNAAFVHYLQHFPIIFEVFGHLNKAADSQTEKIQHLPIS